MTALQAPSLPRRRRSSLRIGAIFLLACTIAFAFEEYLEPLISGGESGETHSSLLASRVVYERLVSSWPRVLRPQHSAIVSIGPTKESDPLGVTADNVCDQRQFIARLLLALAAREPREIVLDKYFGKDRCPADSPGTVALFAAMDQVSRSRARGGSGIPVVVGLRIQEGREAAQIDGQEAYAIDRPLDFDGPELNVYEGIVNTDQDFRRLPVGWTIERKEGKASWQGSLSYVAAFLKLRKDTLNERPVLLGRLGNRLESPFISFIRPREFTVVPSTQVLCASTLLTSAARQACTLGGGGPALENLKGKIVFVGEFDRDRDWHSGFPEATYGVFLQANYVEAILDDRYFVAAGRWVDYLAGLLIFLGLKVALHRPKKWETAASIAAVALVTAMALFIGVRIFGVFIDPAGSTLVIAVMIISWSFEKVVHAGSEGQHGKK